MQFTHLDEKKNPTMVDVSNKEMTNREAIAMGKITMSREAFLAVINENGKKGAVIQTAITAAIMGAKKTSELIPMCHLIYLTSVKCEIQEIENENAFVLQVKAKSNGQTGVEMEALMGVNIGLLTIYDMVKAIDKRMVISEVCLLEKQGGKSGHFVR